MLAGSKKSRTFAALLKKSTSKRSFGEMAEWSIAAVLKTVVLRGTGGSNPSLSAKRCKSNDFHLFFLYPIPLTQKEKSHITQMQLHLDILRKRIYLIRVQ